MQSMDHQITKESFYKRERKGMKRTKSFLTLFAALLLAVSCAVTAYADATTGSITINNAKQGEKYTLYRIFNAEKVSEGVINYSTTSDPASWLVDGTTNPCPFTSVKVGSIWRINLKDAYAGDENKAKASKAIRGWFGEKIETIKTKALASAETDAVAEGKKSVTKTGLPYGYYVILKTSPTSATPYVVSALSLDSASASIYDKNNIQKPGADLAKKVSGKPSASYGVGEEVPYTITFTAVNKVLDTDKTSGNPVMAQVTKYVLTDKVDSALEKASTFSVKYTVAGESGEKTDAVVTDVTGGFTIEIPWANSGTGEPLYGDDVLVTVTYQMKVTSSAKEDMENTVSLAYYLDTDPSTSVPGETPTTTPKAHVKTTGIKINKVEKGKSDFLTGAKFILKNAENKYYVLKEGKVTWDATEANATKVTPASASAEAFTALGKGSYTLYEVEAPQGYVPMKDGITVKINFTPGATADADKFTYEFDGAAAAESNVIKIENSKMSALPETGGAGTRMLIICGAILFFATGIVLVAKKRQYNEG